MERRKLPFAHPRTEEFLTHAFESGAHKSLISQAATNGRLRWVLDAVAVYYAQDVSYGAVGRMVQPPTTHETARQNVMRGMAAIWRESSEEVKEMYPLDTIPIKKPNRREVGEDTKAVMEATQQGLSYQEIVALTGVDKDQLTNRRVVLKAKGVEVPYKHYSAKEYARIVDLAANEDRPRGEYEKIAGTLSCATVQNMALRHKAFVSVVEAVRVSGYYIGPSKIAPARRILEEAGLVLHLEKQLASGKNAGLIQHYYYVASRDLRSVEDELSKYKELDTYKQGPVRRLAGPDTDISVSTNDLSGNADFSPLSSLLLKHKLTAGGRGPKVPYEVLLADCPVPVFRYDKDKRTIYPSEGRKLLDSFLQKRAQELGV